MDEYEGRIEWMNYLKIIWKRKWIILIPALLCAVTAGIFSIMQEPVWEVEAILEGGKFFDIEQNREVLTIEGEQLAGRISEGYYNNLIAVELGFSLEDLPKIRAKNLQWSHIVQVTIRENNIEKAKSTINALFNFIKEDLDKMIETELMSTDSQIEHNNNILDIESQAIENRQKKILKIQKEISLEKERLKLSEENYADIKLLINEKEKQVMTLYNQLERKEKNIEKTKSEIALLNSAKVNIHRTQFIKNPIPSEKPVGPRPGLNAVMACLLGLFIFGLFAFFLEYVDKLKEQKNK